MKWMQSGDLAYLTAPGVGVPHAFTTRKGGVSRGYLTSLNLGCNRGDAPENVKKNYEILGEALGFDPEKLVLTRQIHWTLSAWWGRQTAWVLTTAFILPATGLLPIPPV